MAARLARVEDIVILATLPGLGYPNWNIELSKATWEVAFTMANDVTITIKPRDIML